MKPGAFKVWVNWIQLVQPRVKGSVLGVSTAAATTLPTRT
jgi:hypothetical protein